MPSSEERSLTGLIADAQSSLDVAGANLAELYERIGLLERTFGISADEGISAPLARRQQKRTSVGRAHLLAVHDYIKHHGRVRQADMVSDLKLNSGTVSVATNVLQDAGNIEAVDKIRGSVVWEYRHSEGIPSADQNGNGRTKATAGSGRRK
jgi:hypothetical protein